MQLPNLKLLFSGIEAWHQFLAHFPFVLWTVASVLFALALTQRFAWLHVTALVVGLIGSALGVLTWMTGVQLTKTGGLAAAFGKNLVHRHQADAYTAFVVFTAVFASAAVVRGLRARYPNWRLDGRWMRVVYLLALAFAGFYLFVSTQGGVQLTEQKLIFLRETLNAR